MVFSKGSITKHNKLFKLIGRIDAEALSLKLSKYEFSKQKICWLGYDIDETGYQPQHWKFQDVLTCKIILE